MQLLSTMVEHHIDYSGGIIQFHCPPRRCLPYPKPTSYSLHIYQCLFNRTVRKHDPPYTPSNQRIIFRPVPICYTYTYLQYLRYNLPDKQTRHAYTGSTTQFGNYAIANCARHYYDVPLDGGGMWRVYVGLHSGRDVTRVL